MGRTHATTAGLAAAATGLALHWGVEPTLYATAVAAGAALLPDCDEDGVQGVSTVYYSLGPVSEAACKVVHKVSGGHRHATHWLLAGVVAALLFGLAPLALLPLVSHQHVVAQQVAAGVALAVPSALLGLLAGAALFHSRHLVAKFAAFGATGWLAWTVLPGHWWLAPAAVLGGYTIHLLGDHLFGGVPLFGPFIRRRVFAGHLKTNGALDHALGWACFLALVVVMVMAIDPGAGGHLLHQAL